VILATRLRRQNGETSLGSNDQASGEDTSSIQALSICIILHLHVGSDQVLCIRRGAADYYEKETPGWPKSLASRGNTGFFTLTYRY
jgi:hypothetical protein